MYSAVPSAHSSGRSNFHTIQTNKKQTRRFEFPVIHQHICARTYAGVGEQVTEEETSQNTVPVAFTYFHRTLPPNTGSLPALSPPRPPPGHTGAALSRSLDHAVAPALHAGVRMCSIYRPHRRMRRARRAASPTPSTNLPSAPQPRDPSSSARCSPQLPPGARGRAVQLSRGQPGAEPAAPAPRTAAAPPGGPGGSAASAPPREERGGGAEGRGAARSVTSWAKVTARWPRLLGCSCCSWRAPRGGCQPAAGGGTRRSLITHTHCGRRRCCRRRGCGSPVLCRSGGSSAPSPQWSGRHVGDGHVKGAAAAAAPPHGAAFLLLPSPPLPQRSRLPRRKPRPRNCSCQQIWQQPL